MNILFDIGGTKTRIASSQNPDNFDTPIILDTPKDYGAGVELIKKTITEISRGQRIQSVIGGIAGPFSQKKSSLITSPNLGGWIGKPLVADLAAAFNTSVHVENDSAMVGLGEAVFGAGKEASIVAYITISTGMGGARIVNGKLDERTIGFEPGHQTIDADKTMLPDADGIYIGNYISGKGVENRTHKKPYEIRDESFWEEMARMLAIALNNTIVHWSPEVVVLGGSMMNQVGIPLDKTAKYLGEILRIFPEIPPLKKAELGDLGGLYGSLAYLRNIQHGA